VCSKFSAVSHGSCHPAPVDIARSIEQSFEKSEGVAVGVKRSDRQRELERAMRAHPAGSALGAAGVDGRPHPDAPLGRPPLRLTGRGRRLVAVLGLAAGVGAATLVSSALDGSAASGLHLAGQSSVVVGSGDTLWSIASSVAAGHDVRAVVDRIQEVNGLRGSDLVPGQVLRLP
jgi:nucleoid-associated protein YgaU